MSGATAKKGNKQREVLVDAFIAYDASQGGTLLDHARARSEGPHAHLLAQAEAILQSWKNLEPKRKS